MSPGKICSKIGVCFFGGNGQETGWGFLWSVLKGQFFISILRRKFSFFYENALTCWSNGIYEQEPRYCQCPWNEHRSKPWGGQWSCMCDVRDGCHMGTKPIEEKWYWNANQGEVEPGAYQSKMLSRLLNLDRNLDSSLMCFSFIQNRALIG